MGYAHIDIDVTDHTGWLWLNRPEKRNALSADMWSDLPRAVADLDADPEVRVLVVAARGPAFTVGIDLEMLASLAPEAESEGLRNLQAYEKIKELQGSFTALAEARTPVIAAVHGYCLGAGEISANSPIVVQGIKRILRRGSDLPLDAALDYVALWNAATIRTNDLEEAITAFFEKRPPRFTGT